MRMDLSLDQWNQSRIKSLPVIFHFDKCRLAKKFFLICSIGGAIYCNKTGQKTGPKGRKEVMKVTGNTDLQKSLVSNSPLKIAEFCFVFVLCGYVHVCSENIFKACRYDTIQ